MGSKNIVLFMFQSNISETGFFLRLQVKPTQLGPIDRANSETGTSNCLVCSYLFHAGSSLADFSTLKMEAIRSSETSVHTETTRHCNPENGILHGPRRENLRCHKVNSVALVRKWTIMIPIAVNLDFLDPDRLRLGLGNWNNCQGSTKGLQSLWGWMNQ
jgi:hypothetical protein